MSVDDLITIPEFFANKGVFITGGTGFIGKVLVEKLLRACPDVGNVYMLVRPKKGKALQERIEQLLEVPIFEKLKKENPDALKKLVPVAGDTSGLDLGVSEEDKSMLKRNVSIIFHVAASVRFDDSLKKAIFTNVRSSRDVARLALELDNPVALVHVSTAYCNIDKGQSATEQIYPFDADWKEVLRIAEECDEHILEVLTSKFMDPFPNTYTFTKRLAEILVVELCTGKLPTVILRPTVVIAAYREPFCGWIDNFNGPTGLLVAGGKGILRTVYGDRGIIVDYVAVDSVVNATVVACWHKAVKDKHNPEVSVVHVSKYKDCPVAVGDLVELGKQLYWDVPFEKKLWFPSNKMTNCWYEYYIKVILLHVVPALIIDGLLKLTGNKPFLLKIQRKIYIANMALYYFMTNEWLFLNTKLKRIEGELLDSDKKPWDYYFLKTDFQSPDEYYKFYKTCCEVGRRYLLKEKTEEITAQTRWNTMMMYVLHKTVQYSFYAFMFWFLCIKFHIQCAIWSYIRDYFVNL